ncbi:MAG TPA: hypothetical protein PKV13_00900 [Propionicimonas sp.]|nr:hypothetical protein [Propionicimonas sp.]
MSRPSPEERTILWWLTGAVLVVHVIAVYSPGSPDGSLELPGLLGVDKLIHAALFGAPVYLLGVLTRRIWLWAGVFAAMAGISEVIQWRFIPYRDGDIWDAVSDLVGITLAVLLLLRRRGSASPEPLA